MCKRVRKVPPGSAVTVVTVETVETVVETRGL
jgi:hypothetical protein